MSPRFFRWCQVLCALVIVANVAAPLVVLSLGRFPYLFPVNLGAAAVCVWSYRRMSRLQHEHIVKVQQFYVDLGNARDERNWVREQLAIDLLAIYGVKGIERQVPDPPWLSAESD